jgi:hydrogenase nickel incorporation protein HypB
MKEASGDRAEHHHLSDHDHDHRHGRVIAVEQDILSRNNRIAERNRGLFQANGIFTLNLVSSPGSGKTTLLVRTISELRPELTFAVIEGDQQSDRDAHRIDATGAPVIQVNTGAGCHLDADMVSRAVDQLNPEARSVLMIENVGNLICPALFDLGEAHKVVVISVTEGDDKPIKYPHMFDASGLCIINKIDLLPYVEFDLDRCKEFALQVNPHLSFYEVSAKTGEGLEGWYSWLRRYGTGV